MPSFANPESIRVGDVVQCGFVFRAAADDSLVSPASVSVEVYDPDGTLAEPVFTDSDARVTIETQLAVDIRNAVRPKVTDAENTAGVGLVKVLYTPASAGRWTVYCTATDSSGGAESVKFNVLGKTD